MNDDLPPWVTEGPPDEEPARRDSPPLKTDAHAQYEYRYADGSLAFIVARWDAHNGHKKKRFSPFCWNGSEWVAKMLVESGRRPLFGLPDVIENNNILVVEGEKTAIAAAAYMPPGWAVTTWAGGSSSVSTADWSPLRGKSVTIWPDNDAPGIAASAAILARTPHARIVDLPLDLPDGWDLGDPLPEGAGSAWVQELITGAKAEPSTPPEPGFRPTIDPVDWQDKPIPVREWIVEDLLPTRVVTMLSGDGGLGKSTLALQLAVACATQENWLGQKTKPCKVLIVACEDEPDELHRRLHGILVSENLSFAQLPDIRIIPGAGYDNVMVDFEDHGDHGKPTEFLHFVAAQAKEFGANCVILDSLHDFFAGNENARPQARQFINHLRRIAMDIDGAILLLAHPSVSGLTNKDGRSGSTAWGNTVRSRLYLTRPDDPEATHLLLKTVKANYAKSGGEIRVEYRGGMFYTLDDHAKKDPVYVQVQVDDVFLNCLRACTKQGRRVTNSKHGSYAPKVFATMKSINRSFGKEDFERAMERLFGDGKIVLGPVKNAQRKDVEAIIEVLNAAPHTDEI